MDTLKNETALRISPLRDTAKNLVELAWLLFAAYQWLIVISIPIVLIGSIIMMVLTNADFSPDTTIKGESLYSLKAQIIALVVGLLYIGFAFYYFFRLRKRPEPNTRTKFCILSLYLSVLLMLTYKIELLDHQYILENIRYSETTVKVYDAETKEVLSYKTSYSMAGRRSDQILPISFGVSISDYKESCFRLIDIKPGEVTLSAPGYESKKVLVGTSEGSQTISVYLEKEKLVDPNAL